jgi:hypothetical protein
MAKKKPKQKKPLRHILPSPSGYHIPWRLLVGAIVIGFACIDISIEALSERMDAYRFAEYFAWLGVGAALVFSYMEKTSIGGSKWKSLFAMGRIISIGIFFVSLTVALYLV